MKAKRILACIVVMILLIVTALSPMSVFAVTFDSENYQLRPGNTQASNPEYNMAWLNQLFVRDDVMAIKTARLVPKAEYPYRVTYEEFIAEAGDLVKLYSLDEQTVEDTFGTSLEIFVYLVTAMGMTTDYDTMLSYIASQGIRMPSEMNTSDKMMVSAVYAAMKYNAVYVITGTELSIPRGTTLEGAAVNIIGAFMSIHVPSEINSFLGLGVYAMKDYIEQLNEVPLTDNPSNEEVFHWIKAAAASKKGYPIPLISYDNTTDIQKEYVDYSYCASVLDNVYDITIDTFALMEADKTRDTAVIAKLIVTTMLDEKGVSYNENASCENLFKLACENGGFDLEEEFYSDIYNYDLYVNDSCEKLWFTPFALADQIGGDVKYISIDLNGAKIGSASTTYVALDKTKKQETVKMKVNYDDGAGVSEVALYSFNVIKVKDTSSQVHSDDLVSQIQASIDSVVPQDNITANTVLDGVYNLVTSVSQQIEENASRSEEERNSIIPTYPDATASAGYSGNAQKVNDGVDFDYLKELFGETYAQNEISVTSSYLADKDNNTTVASRAAEVIKENPEIVVAPTSIAAVGGLAGYLFFKKRKPTEFLDIDESEESGSDK